MGCGCAVRHPPVLLKATEESTLMDDEARAFLERWVEDNVSPNLSMGREEYIETLIAGRYRDAEEIGN